MSDNDIDLTRPREGSVEFVRPIFSIVDDLALWCVGAEDDDGYVHTSNARVPPGAMVVTFRDPS